VTVEKINSFGKFGRSIIKRKKSVIVAWILVLAIVLPIVLTAGGISGLQMDSASDNSLESAKAGKIIDAQFAGSIAKNTLVIVISTSNASSLSTQQFIDQLSLEIKSSGNITGVQNITSVYSILIPALNGTNQGVYFAYKNANLTYTLLYSVPAIYSNVWSGAFNETKNNVLTSALNQTSVGVYQVLDNANMTYSLLYGVPATYLGIWSQTYSSTSDIATSNTVAYSQSQIILSAADPASYALYTSHLLDAFDLAWRNSFLDPSMASYTPTQRAAFASNQTNQAFINTYLSSDAAQKAFATALTQAFTLNDFLTNTQVQNNVKLENFSIWYTASSGGISTQYVNATYKLGRTPSLSAFTTLAGDIIWHPTTYGMNDFISTFNAVAYNQTATILKDADLTSYNDYTSHLLTLFNASWVQSFQTLPPNTTVNVRASDAANIAIPQFINAYFSDQKDFASGVASVLTLQDFLDSSPTVPSKLQNFAIGYVSNSSGLPKEFVGTIFNLGENASERTLKTFASNIVWNPSAYTIGHDLNTLVSSFVSPAKDVTLISITLDKSSDKNLLAIRELISTKLETHPAGIKSALVTGGDALDYDFGQSTNNDLELILPITVTLLLVATGLFFRSFVTPLITLGTIGVGLGISQIFPYLVGTYINKVDFMVPTVLLTIMIGVGTDYGIFIIARHREERIYGLAVPQAIQKSITWAGESIATSGTTVIISFFALSATSLVLLQTLGLVVGLGVIVALLVSLTFVPAVIAVLGDRIFWPNTGKRFEKYAEGIIEKSKRKGGYFAKSGAFSVKHGKALFIVMILVTVPLFYMYATATPTYDFLGGAPGTLDSIDASRTLTSSFGGGRLSPTYVVVTFDQPLINHNVFDSGEMATLQAISSQMASHKGVQEVSGPTMPFGAAVNTQTVTNDSDPTTYTAILQGIGKDNKSALIEVKFLVDPYSNDAINYAQDIRNNIHQSFDSSANVSGIYMGGTTGGILDTKNLFVNQFNAILPIVAVGVGIILFIVLGSLILPIFAVLSVLMSIVWTLAITAVVFQNVFNYGLLFITPLILFVLLLGLGMDYNIFILTRIREEAAKGEKLNDAIIRAIEQTGGIITAAAIILAGSLGALMLSSNLLLKEMGFAFCFSILIDAIVVRTYLVPAVMSTFGKWNWYNPIKRLQRIKDVPEEKTAPSNLETP
jgi:putative drug exporter of the RND superfamily